MLTFIVVGLLAILALAFGVLVMAFLPSRTAEKVEQSLLDGGQAGENNRENTEEN